MCDLSDPPKTLFIFRMAFFHPPSPCSGSSRLPFRTLSTEADLGRSTSSNMLSRRPSSRASGLVRGVETDRWVNASENESTDWLGEISGEAKGEPDLEEEYENLDDRTFGGGSRIASEVSDVADPNENRRELSCALSEVADDLRRRETAGDPEGVER